LLYFAFGLSSAVVKVLLGSTFPRRLPSIAAPHPSNDPLTQKQLGMLPSRSLARAPSLAVVLFYVVSATMQRAPSVCFSFTRPILTRFFSLVKSRAVRP
jgi:hypothetical protein